MILRSIAFAFAILILTSISNAHSKDVVHSSFDCTKATQPLEETICNDPDLADLDRKMAVAFQKVIDASPMESRPVIIDAQREWLKRRNRCLPEVRYTTAGCLKLEYSEWLESWPRKLAALGGARGASFTLRMTKFPGLPNLTVSNRPDLCDRLQDAAISNFQRPNKIHFPDEMDGFIRRLTVQGTRWIDLTANAETIGKQVSIIPLLSPKGPTRYDIVLAIQTLNYLSQQHSLLFVPQEQLMALKGALDSGKKLPSNVSTLIEASAPYEREPIQVLRYGIDDYLAEEKNWSEIKLSKIQRDGTLQVTCLLKYPAVSPVGTAFDQWLADIELVQGREGYFSGSAHFLDQHLKKRINLAQLAALRPADIVQFGASWPTVQGDNDSPLQSKLGVAVWGLEGPWNHTKAKRLERDTVTAKAALADYYASTYGVDAADAVHAAEIVTDTILRASFYFYSYGERERKSKGTSAEIEQGIRSDADDFAQRPADKRNAKDATDLIRPAILAGAPKPDIEALIAADAQLGNRKMQFDDRFPGATEPALFFSLERPEIAALLVDKGAGINQTNAFGKTALMYAAHLNLYEALDLLLNAKAKVNEVTSSAPFGPFRRGRLYDFPESPIGSHVRGGECFKKSDQPPD